MKRPCKTGFEQDAFGNLRRCYCYLLRSGVRKKAKRQWWKRFRREAIHAAGKLGLEVEEVDER